MFHTPGWSGSRAGPKPESEVVGGQATGGSGRGGGGERKQLWLCDPNLKLGLELDPQQMPAPLLVPESKMKDFISHMKGGGGILS